MDANDRQNDADVGARSRQSERRPPLVNLIESTVTASFVINKDCKVGEVVCAPCVQHAATVVTVSLRLASVL